MFMDNNKIDLLFTSPLELIVLGLDEPKNSAQSANYRLPSTIQYPGVGSIAPNLRVVEFSTDG
jgi:hypothetical protein